MMIPPEQYARMIEHLPILCVDIVIRNSGGEILLIKRENEPLKGEWWVVGGRVHKGETLEQAAIRKAKEEVGLQVNNLQFIGYYEDAFETNPFGLATPLHSVSVVFTAVVNDGKTIRLDDQSSEWKFSKKLPERFRCTLVRSREVPYFLSYPVGLGKDDL